MMQISK